MISFLNYIYEINIVVEGFFAHNVDCIFIYIEDINIKLKMPLKIYGFICYRTNFITSGNVNSSLFWKTFLKQLRKNYYLFRVLI